MFCLEVGRRDYLCIGINFSSIGNLLRNSSSCQSNTENRYRPGVIGNELSNKLLYINVPIFFYVRRTYKTSMIICLQSFLNIYVYNKINLNSKTLSVYFPMFVYIVASTLTSL